MRHTKSSRPFFGWILVALACTCLAPCWGQQDTSNIKSVTLKDGTVLRWPVSQDGDHYVFEVPVAPGIVKTRLVKTADVASVTYLTDQEAAQQALQRAYEQTQKYRLDPNTSYTLDYYDQVIRDSFRRFLTQYPNSAYQDEIAQKLAAWEAERDLVATGKAKYGGHWMDAAEAAKRTETARAQVHLERGHKLLIQGSFSAALEQFGEVISTTKFPEIRDEAKRLYTETCRQWGESLDRRRQPLNNEIKLADEQVTRARQQQDEAERKLNSAMNEKENKTGTYVLGQDALIAKLREDYERARNRLAAADSHLLEIREELVAVERQLADVQTKAAAYGAGPPQLGAAKAENPSSATSTTAAVAKPVESRAVEVAPPPDVLTGMVGWFKSNWIIAAGVVLVALWAVSRFFMRQ